MATATVYLQEWNGEAESEVATSKQSGTIRFKSADDAVVNSSDPLVKPNAGVYRSVEKYLRTYLESLGDSTEIQNVEVFTSSSPLDGIAIFVKTAEDYATPLSGGYEAAGAMLAPKSDLFTKTSNDPLVLSDESHDTETASLGLYMVMQMEVYPSATGDQTSDISLILRYDEVA